MDIKNKYSKTGIYMFNINACFCTNIMQNFYFTLTPAAVAIDLI